VGYTCLKQSTVGYKTNTIQTVSRKYIPLKNISALLIEKNFAYTFIVLVENLAYINVRSEKALAKIAFIKNRILFAVLKSN